MLLSGLTIRLALFPFGSFQADAEVMRAWAQQLATQPLSNFYEFQGHADHLPGDLWFLWALAHLYHVFSPDMQGDAFLFLLKLVPALADLGIGGMLFLLGRRFRSPATGVFAAALYLFNPAPIFLASVWGQWDALSAFFALAALWLVLRGNVVGALPTLAYAALIKPQFVVLAPFFALAYLRQSFVVPDKCPALDGGAAEEYVRPRSFVRLLIAAAAAVGVVILVCLPFDVGLPPLETRWNLLDLALGSWSVHPYTSVNALNLWATPLAGIGRPDDVTVLFGLPARSWGTLLLVVAYATTRVLFWRRGSDRVLVWACLAMSLALFVLPTRIHERYLLPAVVFAAAVAAIAPGLRWLYVGLSALLLGNVVWVYRIGHDDFGLPFLPADAPWVVAASLAGVAMLLYVLARGLTVLDAKPETALGDEWRTLTQPRLPQLLAVIERGLRPESLSWVVLLLVVPVLAVGFTLTVGWRLHTLPFVDFDYWWHVATGDWILDHHRVPTTDPFSWTHGGQEWFAHEWLAEVAMALAVRVGGYAGAIVLTAVVAVAGFWWLLTAARTYGLSRRAVCLLALLWGGALLRGGVMVVRPQVFTFALFGGLLAHLAAYDTGRRRTLWLLPPLFALWINLNLTALIGIACLGAFALDRLVRCRLDRHLVTVCLLSLAALAVNPRGPALLAAVLKYQDPDALRYDMILEWQSPWLGDPTHLPFLLALPVAPVAVWQLVQLRLWPALPVVVLLYESFTSVRFVPIYVILAFVFAGWLVYRSTPASAPPAVAGHPLIPWRRWSVATALTAAAVVLVVAAARDRSQFRWQPNAWGYPEDAATFLLAEYPDARLFNAYEHGGYLIHRFNGANLVYVDGREEMYGDPFLRRYFDLIDGGQGWQETFEREGITAALVGPRHGLMGELANAAGWEEVYRDVPFVLYVRPL